MQPENMRAFANGQHERGLGTVDDVACRKLVPARLKQRLGAHRRQDREYRANRNVGVDVGGAVEWIGIDREGCARVERQRVLVLLRAEPCDGRLLECRNHHLVGHEVELLLVVRAAALGVAQGGHVAGQRSLCDQARDLHPGLGQVDDRFRYSGFQGLAPCPVSQIAAQRYMNAHALDPPLPALCTVTFARAYMRLARCYLHYRPAR